MLRRIERNRKLDSVSRIGEVTGVRFAFCSQVGWGLALAFLVLKLTGCGFTLVPPGFVHSRPEQVCRGWLDCNSQRRPSFTLEQIDRLPPEAARVRLFRWKHGADPGAFAGSLPTVIGEPSVPPAPAFVPGDEVPPLAPPPLPESFFEVPPVEVPVKQVVGQASDCGSAW